MCGSTEEARASIDLFIDQYFWTLTFLVLAAMMPVASRRFYGAAVTPFSVFLGIWLADIGLFEAGWIGYITVRPDTWWLITMNLGGFLAGWIVGHTLGRRARVRSSSYEPAAQPELLSGERLMRVVTVCFVLGMIGLLNFLWNVHLDVGITAYVANPSAIRINMSAGYISEDLKLLNWLNVLNVVLCTYELLVVKMKKYAILAATILIISIAATFLMEDRTRFFFAALWAFFLVISVRRWSPRKTFAMAALAVTVLAAQFLIVAEWLGKVYSNEPEIAAVSRLPESAAFLAVPYVYATASFPALQEYIDSNPKPTYGAMTFYPVWRVAAAIDRTISLPDIIGDFYHVPFRFNTFTWLQQFYTDFGTAGIIFGPLIVGILAGFVYRRMLSDGRFYLHYLNSLICFGLTLSVFVNHLTQGPFWYFAAVGPIIATYCALPSRRATVVGPFSESYIAQRRS